MDDAISVMKDLGLLLVVVGALLLLVGSVLLLTGRLPWLGNLPGDLHLHGKRWTFSFPIVTCILASIVLTLLLNLILRIFKK